MWARYNDQHIQGVGGGAGHAPPLTTRGKDIGGGGGGLLPRLARMIDPILSSYLL